MTSQSLAMTQTLFRQETKHRKFSISDPTFHGGPRFISSLHLTLYCLHVGNVVDVSKIYAASIFRVEVNVNVHVYILSPWPESASE
jgi:hypothetical protein